MTTISFPDWWQSPDIVVGECEHRRLVTVALTDVTKDAEQIDFLLHELDRARLVADDQLPSDIIRLGSIVRYRSPSADERMVKLVLPSERDRVNDYRLSVTSMHGAALLGLGPGQMLSWLTPGGERHQVEVISVANTLAAMADNQN